MPKFAFDFLALVGVALASSQSYASTLPTDLKDLLMDQWKSVEASACAPDANGDSTMNTDWMLTKFFVNVSPSVTVGVRGFADLTIAPEIEFVFEKSSLQD
jgi:hypothetical protein